MLLFTIEVVLHCHRTRTRRRSFRCTALWRARRSRFRWPRSTTSWTSPPSCRGTEPSITSSSAGETRSQSVNTFQFQHNVTFNCTVGLSGTTRCALTTLSTPRWYSTRYVLYYYCYYYTHNYRGIFFTKLSMYVNSRLPLTTLRACCWWCPGSRLSKSSSMTSPKWRRCCTGPRIWRTSQ